MGPQWPCHSPHVHCWLSHQPGGTEAALQERDDSADLSTAFPAEMCESERAWPFTFLISTGFLPLPYKYYPLSVFPLSLFINVLLQYAGLTYEWGVCHIFNSQNLVMMMKKITVQVISLLGFKFHICLMLRLVYCFTHHRGTSYKCPNKLNPFLTRPEYRQYYWKLVFVILTMKMGYRMQLSFPYGFHVARSIFK